MLLKTTSCVPSRSAGSVFDCVEVETVRRQHVDDVAFGARRIFRNPLHTRAAHGDGVFEARFAQTGGLDFAAEIDGARGIQAGADAHAVLTGLERDLVRAPICLPSADSSTVAGVARGE